MAEAKATIEANGGKGIVTITLFTGRKIEVDFTQTPWSARLDEHLVTWIAEICERYWLHGLEVTGLPIRPVPPQWPDVKKAKSVKKDR